MRIKNLTVFCTQCIITQLCAHKTTLRIIFLIITKPGSFTHNYYERTGDRRLLVIKHHQGGCNHATKYKHQCSSFFSKLLSL